MTELSENSDVIQTHKIVRGCNDVGTTHMQNYGQWPLGKERNKLVFEAEARLIDFCQALDDEPLLL